MGMFDYYNPVPSLRCPLCASEVTDWQGRGGPCALVVWRQGASSPVDQRVPDDVKAEQDVLEAMRLPAEFEIYATCCGGMLFASCTAPSGTWSTTELETASNARQRSYERRSDFKRRLRWLSTPARSIE